VGALHSLHSHLLHHQLCQIILSVVKTSYNIIDNRQSWVIQRLLVQPKLCSTQHAYYV